MAALQVLQPLEERRIADKHGQSLFSRPVPKVSQSERLALAKVLWQNKVTFSRKQLARAVRLPTELVEAVFH